MNVQEQIAKLESLLDRIRRKAAEPRPDAGVAATPSAEQHAEEAAPMTSGSPPTARVETPMPASVRPHPTPAAGTPAAREEEAPTAEVEELDMMDSEIVEIGAAVPASPASEATELDIDEPVPESAPRAAHGLAAEADLEPPVKTPPPESGRQVMAPVPQVPPIAPHAPVTFHDERREAEPAEHAEPAEIEELDLTGSADVDALLEPDHSGGPISRAPPGMPTMEQLGETVELEGADAPAAEIELQAPHAATEAPLDELELSLPRPAFSGGYDATLAPPPGAAADLERHRQEEIRLTAAAAPQSLAEPMAMSAMPPTEVAPERPIVVERPPTATLHAAEVIVEKRQALPETFLDLLDLSLRL